MAKGTKDEKKSENINKHYPMLGCRVELKTYKKMIKLLREVVDLHNNTQKVYSPKVKTNSVFVEALGIGLDELKKKF